MRSLRHAVPPFAVLALSAFWLLLSGHYTALLFTFGAASVGLVSWLGWRAGLTETHRPSARWLVGLPVYLLWLGGQILLSSVQVTRRVWARRIALDPVVQPTAQPPMSPLGQATYANSITLTPGTLALDVYDDRIRVHSLEGIGLDDLDSGAMVRRVQRLDSDQPRAASERPAAEAGP